MNTHIFSNIIVGMRSRSRLRFRNSLRTATIAAAVLVVACDAPKATRPEAPYDTASLTNGLHYHWANGSTVRVGIATTNLPASTDLAGAVKRAIAAWNVVPQFGEFTLELATNNADANIIIFDQITPLPVQPAACSFDAHGASGYTYFCPSHLANGSTSTAPDSALRMNLTTGSGKVTVVIRIDRVRVSSAAAYDAVVAHELGHALGIGAHSGFNDDVMFGAPTVATPSARDKAALRSALGAAADIRL